MMKFTQFNKLMMVGVLSMVSFGLSIEAVAQTQRVGLSISNMQAFTNGVGDPQMTLDLLDPRLRSTVSPGQASPLGSGLEIKIASGLGGASAYLVVNSVIVDSVSVDTGSEQLFEKVSLKNSESEVRSAVLVVLGPAKIESAQLILGPVEVVQVSTIRPTTTTPARQNRVTNPQELQRVIPPFEVYRPNGEGVESSR